MKQKLKDLVHEERPIKERLKLACIVALFFAFTLCLFAPYEQILTAPDEFFFGLSDVWWAFLLLAALCFAAVALVALAFRGKLYDLAVTLVFAVTLDLYLQGNFLNANYGQMTGVEIVWERYGAYSLWNTLLTVVIILIPFILLYFSKKVWKNTLRLVSLGIVLVQVITLVTLVAQGRVAKEKQYVSGFGYDGTFSLSKDRNVIMVIMDEFDNDFIAPLLSEEPDALDYLDGFTYYPDSVSVYSLTFPAVTQYMTGKMWYMQEYIDDYLVDAWKEDELFRGMKDEGYDVRILADTKHFEGIDESLIDNFATGYSTISSYPGIVSTMMQLIAYRYLPHVFKAGFWMYAGEFSVYASDEVYVENDPAFYDELLHTRISADREEPAFRYIHLYGMHEPYTLSEDMGRVSIEKASSLNQSKGQMKLFKEYLDQLKEAGIYDNSTIILTADHGKREWREDIEITDARNPVLFIKPAGSRGELKTSDAPVWTYYMKPTLMDAAGLADYSRFGCSLIREEEPKDQPRYLYQVVSGGEQNELVEYEVKGNANVFANWEKTGETWPLGPEYLNH